MARREIGEINAGSMADIAFLLLIFFLVTTTMEVDAGIGRQLPLKLDVPPPENIEFNKRNVLEILANSNDDLMVEGEFIEFDELEEFVVDFYTANINREDADINMPNYETVTIAKCQTEIAKVNKALEKDPESKLLNNELSKWQTKLELCQSLPTKQYKEIHKSAVIQLKNQSGTSYGLYIAVQNVLKKVVNELRVATCEEMGWPKYFELREDLPEDQVYIERLRILVPERIIESKIES